MIVGNDISKPVPGSQSALDDAGIYILIHRKVLGHLPEISGLSFYIFSGPRLGNLTDTFPSFILYC